MKIFWFILYSVSLIILSSHLTYRYIKIHEYNVYNLWWSGCMDGVVHQYLNSKHPTSPEKADNYCYYKYKEYESKKIWN